MLSMGNVTDRQRVTDKIVKILWNLGVNSTDSDFLYLLEEGQVMREMGYTYKQIDKALEDKRDLRG